MNNLIKTIGLVGLFSLSLLNSKAQNVFEDNSVKFEKSVSFNSLITKEFYEFIKEKKHQDKFSNIEHGLSVEFNPGSQDCFDSNYFFNIKNYGEKMLYFDSNCNNSNISGIYSDGSKNDFLGKTKYLIDAGVLN